MDPRLATLLEELGFRRVDTRGASSLWTDGEHRQVLRVIDRGAAGVELSLRQDVRFLLDARVAPNEQLLEELLEALAAELPAQARARDGLDLAALERAFTPLAEELGLELALRQQQGPRICSLRYWDIPHAPHALGDEPRVLELGLDSLTHALVGSYRGPDGELRRRWVNGEGAPYRPLHEWAAACAVELREAVLRDGG